MVGSICNFFNEYRSSKNSGFQESRCNYEKLFLFLSLFVFIFFKNSETMEETFFLNHSLKSNINRHPHFEDKGNIDKFDVDIPAKAKLITDAEYNNLQSLDRPIMTVDSISICSKTFVKYLSDHHMIILSSRPDPYPYECVQRFEAANRASVLHLSCFSFYLRFSCKFENLRIKLNNATIHSYCSEDTLPIKHFGKSIDIKYERILFGIHGGYTCSVVALPFVKPEGLTFATCGISNYEEKEHVSLRVINGVNVKRKTFPWMALLRVVTHYGEHLCGGTLISSRHVVTAAHCIHDQTDVILVGLGKVNLTDSNEEGSLWLESHNYSIHPDFDQFKLTNDIGVVLLPTAVEFDDNIKPICFPSEEIGGDFGGYHVTALGWGSTKYQEKTTEILQRVDLTIWKNEDCRKVWTDFDISIEATAICALGEGKDTCNGDSGGPLLLKMDHRWVLLGITSYGFECAKPGIPGVYTRVSKYKSWLEEFLLETTPSA